MNLLLLDPDEIDEIEGDGRVHLSGRRARHLIRVLGVAPGDTVRAGVLGRAVGEVAVEEVSRLAGGTVVLDGSALPTATAAPAAAPSIRLTLALPRPKALRRILRSVATLAVERLDLVNAWRVEKSYFQSPVLEAEAIRRELLLGAEQGATTRLPEVALHRFLMGYFESLTVPPDGTGTSDAGDAGDASHAGTEIRLLAHPRATAPLEDALGALRPSAQRVHLALGPEGGWTERELETFERHGFAPVGLGPWVLTSGEAVVAAVAQLVLLGRLRAARG